MLLVLVSLSFLPAFCVGGRLISLSKVNPPPQLASMVSSGIASHLVPLAFPFTSNYSPHVSCPLPTLINAPPPGNATTQLFTLLFATANHACLYPPPAHWVTIYPHDSAHFRFCFPAPTSPDTNCSPSPPTVTSLFFFLPSALTCSLPVTCESLLFGITL